MKTLLVLNTSPRTDAISRGLTRSFIDQWLNVNPDGKILERDIGANPPEHLDDELIDALRRNPEKLSPRQLEVLDRSNKMIEELALADAVVIGAPMHNFTITGAMRTWIDHIARPGKTFGYEPEKGPIGLLNNKPIFVISTRGGQYGDGDPDNPNPADFQSDYLRHIFKFVGLSDVRIIAANGLDMGDEARAKGLEQANAKILQSVAA